jgi:hypothetical protein
MKIEILGDESPMPAAIYAAVIRMIRNPPP